MKTNLGWIKYVAIAFGLVLALGIISTIVNGGVYVLKGLGLIENELQLSENGNGTYSQEYTGNLESVSINFNAGNLTLQTGNQFKVEGSNISSSLTAKMEKGELVIEDKNKTNFLSNIFKQNDVPSLIVTIPEGIQLKNLYLKLGAGRGEINGVVTEDLTIKQGAGEIIATKLKAESGKLEGGAGAVHFSDVNLNNYDVDCGVGLIEIQGIVTGEMNINCGVGQTNLDITGNVNDYYITADQGIGPITINGLNILENGTGAKSALNRIDIEGGVGPVTIVFN